MVRVGVGVHSLFILGLGSGLGFTVHFLYIFGVALTLTPTLPSYEELVSFRRVVQKIPRDVRLKGLGCQMARCVLVLA